MIRIDVAKAIGLGSGYTDHLGVLGAVYRQFGPRSNHLRNAILAREVLFTNGIPYSAIEIIHNGKKWSD
jgi:hypothetical protein